jgi:hypothetical protein
MRRCSAKDLEIGDIVEIEDGRFSAVSSLSYVPGELIVGDGCGMLATALRILTRDGDRLSVHPDRLLTVSGKAKLTIRWALFGRQ